MDKAKKNRNILALVFISFIFCDASPGQQTVQKQSWKQWGGITRDFQLHEIPQQSLSTKPRLVWTKNIGPGHSAIIVKNGYGFCQFLDGKQEVIRKFNVQDGQTIWEHKYEVSYASSFPNYAGPHATPAISNGTLVIASIDAQIHALSCESGSVTWSTDLKIAYGLQLPQSGYASSPLICDNVVVLPTLGQATHQESESYDPDSSSSIPGLVGLNLENGTEVWRTKSFRSSHGSPILINLSNQPTVVLHGMFELVGIAPSTGVILWRQLLRQIPADNVSFTPIWDPQRIQFLVSHGYCSKGTQAVGVTCSLGKWRTKINWTNRDQRTVHTNGVLSGNLLISTNRSPATLMTAIRASDGKTVFRKRGFGKCNFLAAGQTLIILDESGKLMSATIENGELKENWRINALGSGAWTVPTVAGRYLLVRDAKQLKMFRFD